MRVGTVKWMLLLLCVLCIGALTLWAQTAATGSVVGTITDQSGAVVPGARVTITDTATGNTQSTSTNNEGHYIFVNVTPGTYNLKITKSGFSTTSTTQVVRVGLTNTVNLTLHVGQATTTVEVQAAGTELQTLNSTVGNTVTGVALQSLPSLGRDVSTFMTLQPGVSPDGSVAGAVVDNSTFMLDGGNNTSDMDGSMSVYTPSYAGDPTGGAANQSYGVAAGATGVMPTPADSVEEFKVNSANQTADFNGSSGAEVQVVTRRGTNAWHGSLYEYYLDNNFSANTWDNNFNGVGVPSYHYNRFGGSIGGPIIPKTILGGKTYFFANYQGFRWPNSQTIFRNVPSPALRLGLLTDPASGKVYNLNPYAVTYNGTNYPANFNCPGGPCDPRGLGINPMVQNLWNKYEPASNASCHYSLCDGANVLGYSANVGIPQNDNFGVARIDHDFGSKWHFFSSYRYYHLTRATADQVDIGGFFSGDTLGSPSSLSNRPQVPWYLVLGLTTNISPYVTNSFHFSFLRNYWAWGTHGDPPQVASLGGALEPFSGESATQMLAPYNVNTQQTRTRFWDGHDQSYRDDITMLKGNHLFQFGGTFEHNWDAHQRTDNGGGINNQPVYILGNGSRGAGSVDVPFCTDSAFSAGCGELYSAALGMVTISQIAYTRSGTDLALNPPLTPASTTATIPYYNVYFSDSWHMKPTLTLTYGLGWALEMPPVETNGKQVELVDQADQLISTEAYLTQRKKAALQGQVYNPEVGFALVGNTAQGLKYPYNPYYGQFSPRVALAWNPQFDPDSFAGKIFGHDSTVFRGGYGRIYGRLNGVDLVLVPLLGTGLIQPVQCFNNTAVNPGVPGSGGACTATAPTAATAFRVGVDGLSAPIPQASATLVQPDYPGFNAISAGAGEALDPNFRPNAVDSWDFTIQRQLTNKLTMELGYIGRRITHEYQPININAVPYMMTKGGQTFSSAYSNLEVQLGCAAGPVCASTAPTFVAPQPFFEAAMNPAYCAGYANCTTAVVNKELGNFGSQSVWSLWSDLDAGGFNFARSMMNTPFNCVTGNEFGCGGQLSSGVGVNASVGYGNYNGGFASLKMSDWKGLTMQSNFTWSKALGTGAVVQATSEYTADDPFNLSEMYGPQAYDRKFVYTMFLVYQPPIYKGQEGFMGRVLGGWTLAPIFTAGSGQPLAVFTTNGGGQAFGEGDATNYFSNENAVPITPISGSSAHYGVAGNSSTGVGTGGLPINIFADPNAAFNNFRNPILGIDKRDGGYGILTGLPYWNMDLSIRKNIRISERVSTEGQIVFTNVLNHMQPLDPWGMALYSPESFGNVLGSANPRQMEFGFRVSF